MSAKKRIPRHKEPAPPLAPTFEALAELMARLDVKYRKVIEERRRAEGRRDK